MPTIKNLTTLTPSDRLYIHLNTKAMRYRFMADAEREGITYADGTSATDVTAEDIVCLFCDGTLANLSWDGHVHYQHRKEQGSPCIDYKKYITGKDDFIFSVQLHVDPPVVRSKSANNWGSFFYFIIFFTFSLSANKSPVFSMILSALFWRSSSLICDAILFLA